ncbi:MAG: hypothetical protein AAB320_03220 [Elusimicrobiota bacterium]
MLPTDPKLKELEALAAETAKLLNSLGAETRRLKETNARLDGENRRLKEELKAAALGLSRQERLRARLEKLSQKLERLG